MTTAESINTPKSAAEFFSKEFGWSIFILQNPDHGSELQLKARKRPAVNWELYQIMRPSQKQFDRWFSKNPNYNIAAVTGSVSSMIAIDVDGQAAVDRINQLIPEMTSNLQVAFDNTMKNRTGSGGQHVIFSIEENIDDLHTKVLWTDGQEHSEIKLYANGSYIAVPPSRHPSGERYESNLKDPYPITRELVDQFIRLITGRSPEQRPPLHASASLPRTEGTNNRLTLDKMHELLRWVKNFYNPGVRDHLIFYISGMLRKNGGYPLEDARAFVKLLCESSSYPDEDLDKSLTVVDNTYRKDLEVINGRSGLYGLLVTSYQSKDQVELNARIQACERISQIIEPAPSESSSSVSQEQESLPTTVTDPACWLSRMLAADKNLDIVNALVNEVLRLDHYKTLDDAKEILWYDSGAYHYGGENRINVKLEELGRSAVRNSTRREVIDRIKIKTLTRRDSFDKDPLIRTVKNGLVDLRTGERLPHDPEEYPSLIQIPHNYYTPQEMQERIASRPKGSQFICKKILFEFLCNVNDDPLEILMAVEYWAYCLIGDNRFQKALMDTGPPDSGKSLHLKLTKAFLGPKNVSTKTLQELTENRFAKADLYGKLANICADISSSRLKDIATFKLIVSGDDISAEKKGKDPFTFPPAVKLMFSANVPLLPNDELDDAYYKRWILKVFGMKKKQFLDKSKDVEINPYLFQQIVQDEDELSDLLYISVQAAMKLIHQRGFSGGKSITDIDTIYEEYVRKAKPVVAWVEDNCVLGTNYEDDKTLLYADFSNYCERERLPGLRSITALGKELCERYTSVKDERVGSRKDRKHVWKGITLRSSIRAEEQTEILGEDRAE